MSRSRLVNLSIDLDGLGCYHEIHGLPEPADPTAIYRVALPRFRAFCRELGARATLFVIASDLDHPEVVDALREAVDEGHEVASHTMRHPYNLREWSERSVAAEIIAAEDAIEAAVGTRPVGFRTPGYNVDTRILRILAERGYRYDSSVFPCPPYYLAKGAVMAVMAAVGRPSGSSMTHPAALRAPLQPYRPSRYDFSRPGDRKHSLPLWEIPVGVTPWTRVPVIGTSIGGLPPVGARALGRSFKAGQRTLQVEFHGVDFMDRNDSGVLPSLAARQPDLRRAWTKKRDSYLAFFDVVARGASMITLAELADRLDAEAGPTVVSGRSARNG